MPPDDKIDWANLVAPDPFMATPVAQHVATMSQYITLPIDPALPPVPNAPRPGSEPKRVEINGPGMACGDKSCNLCWRDDFACPDCNRLAQEKASLAREKDVIAEKLNDTRYFMCEIARTVGQAMPGDDDEERYSWGNMRALRNAVEAKMEDLNGKATVDKAAHDAAIAKVEEERDAYDREADNLAAALEYVTIERDYLLNIVAWHEDEMLRLMERVEELEASNG